MKEKIDAIVLDAANTIIYKPKVYEVFLMTLKNHGYIVNENEFLQKHKLLSEILFFPDITGEEFYKNFNSELLLALGIIPNIKLLDDIFYSCKNLPWEFFDDFNELRKIDLPIYVFSNFNNKLSEILNSKDDFSFEAIITSEEVGFAKPSIEFYLKSLDIIKENPENLIYIGDSLKLDVIPGAICKMNSYLIDRNNFFPNFESRISSFKEISILLKP